MAPLETPAERGPKTKNDRGRATPGSERQGPPRPLLMAPDFTSDGRPRRERCQHHQSQDDDGIGALRSRLTANRQGESVGSASLAGLALVRRAGLGSHRSPARRFITIQGASTLGSGNKGAFAAGTTQELATRVGSASAVAVRRKWVRLDTYSHLAAPFRRLPARGSIQAVDPRATPANARLLPHLRHRHILHLAAIAG